MVKLKNSGGDKVLTVIFVVSILIGFYLVSMVNAGFENELEEVTLYKTNSATNFIELTLPSTGDYEKEITGQYDYQGSYFLYERTPVYLGNDTWTIAINETSALSWSYAQYVIEIPNMDEFIISEMTWNLTKNLDTDIIMYIDAYSVETLGVKTDSDIGTQIYSNINVGSVSGQYFNDSVNIDLGKAIDVYDKANEKAQHYIIIQLVDSTGDGMSAWNFQLELEIVGKQIATYNVIQQLELALGIAIAINVFVIIFMTDEIDIGGFKNDIPNKKRR